jgi:hypothetical protein
VVGGQENRLRHIRLQANAVAAGNVARAVVHNGLAHIGWQLVDGDNFKSRQARSQLFLSSAPALFCAGEDGLAFGRGGERGYHSFHAGGIRQSGQESMDIVNHQHARRQGSQGLLEVGKERSGIGSAHKPLNEVSRIQLHHWQSPQALIFSLEERGG